MIIRHSKVSRRTKKFANSLKMRGDRVINGGSHRDALILGFSGNIEEMSNLWISAVTWILPLKNVRRVRDRLAKVLVQRNEQNVGGGIGWIEHIEGGPCCLTDFPLKFI